jgi:hypothetical protein
MSGTLAGLVTIVLFLALILVPWLILEAYDARRPHQDAQDIQDKEKW